MPSKKKASEAVASQEEDTSMTDAQVAESGTPEVEDDVHIDEQRIRIVSFAQRLEGDGYLG